MTGVAPVPTAAARQTGQSALRVAAARHFRQLRGRVQRGIAIETAGALLPVLAAYAAVTFVLDRGLRLEVPFRALLLLAATAFVARIVVRRFLRPLRVRLDDDEMALAVERHAPELQDALISSLQFERVLDGGRTRESGELMQHVIAQMHARLSAVPFTQPLDAGRVRRYLLRALLCIAAFVGWGAADGAALSLWARRNLLLSSVEWPRYTSLRFLAVAGDVVRLPQGDPLTLRVGVSGPVPDQVFLRSTYSSGEQDREPMSRTAAGEFTLTMESMLEDAELVATGGDGISAPLRVQIVERPRIEDLAITVVYPDYMQKEPELVPGTEGEIRVLRGSELQLRARSHKPVAQAFLLFADQKEALALEGDRAFAGTFAPKQGGALVVDVIDRDQLGAGAPPRLLLRVVDDKPPTIDFKLRGISSLVTPQVRIPGELKIKDDFGIQGVSAAFAVVEDAPTLPRAPGEPAPGAPPFGPIESAFADPLQAGAVRFETTASLDFKPLCRSAQDDDPANPVRPGMLLTIRFQAKDNFGPGDPHETLGETLTFRVVTRERLVDELRRRQVEQRQEVTRIRDEVAIGHLTLAQNPNPTGDDARARPQLKALAQRQQAAGRRASFAADLYQRILWEYENNRIWEPGKVREYESLTSVPLAALAREAFPATAHQVGTFADSGDEELRASAIQGYKDIVARLDAIIKVMEEVETLAALIEQLRGVINTEDQAIKAVERRIREAGENVFRTK